MFSLVLWAQVLSGGALYLQSGSVMVLENFFEDNVAVGRLGRSHIRTEIESRVSLLLVHGVLTASGRAPPVLTTYPVGMK